jgi:putative AlgH/UPF0301 family transcriptional regulator
MKDLTAGTNIKSTAELIGSFFEDTTILIVEHNDEGSTGFVTNKPFGKSLHELAQLIDRTSLFCTSDPISLMVVNK